MPQFQLDTSGPVALKTAASPCGSASTRWEDLDTFTQGYIEALFFTSEGPEEGKLGDAAFADLTPETLGVIIADCAKFQVDVIKPIGQAIGFASLESDDGEDYTPVRAGRDFWLTRNGHGVGFWDRGLPGGLGETLSDLARGYGNVDAYLGDDGLVYLA